VHRIATLLVGSSEPAHFNLHAEQLTKFIIEPLRAHVFSIIDEEGAQIFTLPDRGAPKLPLREALPYVLGKTLKVVGLVSAGSTCKYCLSLSQKNAYSTSFVKIYSPGVLQSDAYRQWYKVQQAWRLMAMYENQVLGSTYDVVVKLRFDCTPLGNWNLCASDAIKLNGSFSAIHACTDHVFWGRRAAMEVASLEMFPSIDKYFRRDRPDPMQRSLSVSAMLGSLLATPRELWPMKLADVKWKHFNKVGTLPYIDMHANLNSTKVASYADMVENMRLARENGLEYVDPVSPSFKSLGFRRGVQANPNDYKSGLFTTEKDFLVWMIMKNVTVCDLGAETTAVLYKGSSKLSSILKCVHYLRAFALFTLTVFSPLCLSHSNLPPP
jgi:hypothetical protein